MNSGTECFDVYQTPQFRKWLSKLRDRKAKGRILATVRRTSLTGSILGDVKPIGGSISEFRLDVGPGYRVYFAVEGGSVLLLLVGGDKSSQKRDIVKAKRLLEQWRALR